MTAPIPSAGNSAAAGINTAASSTSQASTLPDIGRYGKPKPGTMKTFVYSPDARIYIARGNKQYDVSKDLVRGQITRKENAVSTATWTLANKDQRYSGARFDAMDRVVIWLKRIRWVQVFSGYLDSVPFLTIYPGLVDFEASCTLKRLLHTWWDPGLEASQKFFDQFNMSNTEQMSTGQESTDSGLGQMLIRLLVEVGGWKREQVHVQKFPNAFMTFMEENLKKMTDENEQSVQQFRRMLLGDDTSLGVGAAAGRAYDTTSGQYAPPAIGAAGVGKAFYIAEIIAATDERSMGPKAGSAQTSQGVKDAAQKGAEAQTGSNPFDPAQAAQQAKEAEAWENLSGVGSQWEESNAKNDAAILAVATALVESELTMYASPAVPESMNFPHDAVQKPDFDSCGIFQQRNNGAWGTVAQRMNARASAGMFLNALNKFDWRNMDPGAACQRVQGSRFPEKYGQRMEEARQLVRAARTGQQTTQPSTGPNSAPLVSGVGTAAGTVPTQIPAPVPPSTSSPTLNNGQVVSTGPTSQVPAAGTGAGVGIAGTGKPTPDSEGAIQWGLTQMNVPYVWGGTTPRSATNPTGGMDCSGFVGNAFKAIGIQLPRTTQAMIAAGYQRVPASMAQRGDILFPHDNHVGIYLGGGTMLHTGGPPGVEFSPIQKPLEQHTAILRLCGNGGPGPASFNDPSMNGPGSAPPTQSGIQTGTGGTTGGASEPIARNLFTYQFVYGQFQTQVSEMFKGEKAFINDQPLIQMVQAFAKAGLRTFASAPNGDFVAYYPDYFGIDNANAVWNLEDIEIRDFKINKSDAALTTHVYVAGDQTGMGQPVTTAGWLDTAGVVTIENEWLWKRIQLVSPGGPEALNAEQLMRKYGVRPLVQEYAAVQSHRLEFLLATQIFMQKWAEQYRTNVSFTFMPELFPGMRLNLVGHNLQVYVTQVTHNFDFEPGGGFTTTASVMAPTKSNMKNLIADAFTKPEEDTQNANPSVGTAASANLAEAF